jgi:hypothetical protein
MKYPSLFFLCSLCSSLFSQQVDLTLTAYDSQGKPMPSIAVNFIETETRELVTVKTNAEGKLHVVLKKGKLWQINVLKIVDNHMWQVVIPQIPGAISTQSRVITYDYTKWLRENRPYVNRKLLDLKTENVKNQNKAPTTGFGQVRLMIRKNDKKPLTQYPVAITCYKLLKTYSTATNLNGEAFFTVPIDNEYQVDIGEFENFTYADLPNKSGMVLEKAITFEPCTFHETIKGDTLVQDFSSIPQPCTGRNILTLTVNVTGAGPYANKVIGVKQVETGKIYQSKTNGEGISILALPLGYHYEYEDGEEDLLANKIQVDDLTRAFGRSTSSKTITISPKKQKRATKVKLFIPEKDSMIYKHFANNKVKITDFRKPSGNLVSGSYVLYVDPDNGVGIASGLLMTTGTVQEAIGPNDFPNASYARNWMPCSETDLDKMNQTHDGNFFDACILEIDIMPTTNTLVLEYLLGSEEYEEYLEFDDSFGIFLGKKGAQSLSMVSSVSGSSSKISVSSINPAVHNDLYRANATPDTKLYKTWQYDGFTQKFVTKVNVEKGKTYTLKLIIADYHDSIYDSGAFVDFKCE